MRLRLTSRESPATLAFILLTAERRDLVLAVLAHWTATAPDASGRYRG